MSIGRIVFDDSPWPDGHALEQFRLTLKGDDKGNIRLHVDATTERYADSGEPRGANAGASPWQRPEVWLDSRRAICSSTQWDNAGFQLPSPRASFTEDKLDGMVLTADPVKQISLDKPLEDLAIGIWVLGNGIAGDHRLRLRRVQPYVFDVDWTGRLRNSFLGENDFHRSFHITARAVRLS